MDVRLCERVIDLRHSLFHLLNCLITTAKVIGCKVWTKQRLRNCLDAHICQIVSDKDEHPWDKLCANLPHLQFLANNCVYSSHTDIKLYTHYIYRYTTVLIHEILYLANQPWCSDFLTPPKPLISPHTLPAFFESQCRSKNWFLIHARGSKSSLKHSIRFCGIFPSLKHNFIAYHSSKVSSRPDCIFEIHQLWQSGFSRVYSNCYCGCSFEAEIINIGQSPHEIYSNNILNF